MITNQSHAQYSYLLFHHSTQFLPPKVLIVRGMSHLLQVLHVGGQKQMPQWREVTMALCK